MTIKRAIALLLSLLLLLSLAACGKTEDDEDDEPSERSSSREKKTPAPTPVPTPGVTVDRGFCGDDLKWLLDENGVLFIRGSGAMEDWDYAGPWDSYRADIRALVIEAGVTTIGAFAFAGCGNLQSASLPQSLTAIGAHAFEGCGCLAELKIPKGVTEAGSFAFEGCGGLKDPIDTALIAVPEPGEIVDRGYCGEDLDWLLDENGVLFIRGSGAMESWNDKESPWYEYIYQIDNLVIEDGVTTIGSYAFADCDELIGVTLPDSVTSIGADAFLSCESLTGLSLPDRLQTIDGYAFSYCESLASLEIPDRLETLGEGAFTNCIGMRSLRVSPKNRFFSAEDGLLYDKKQTTLLAVTGEVKGAFAVPDGVAAIGVVAFDRCDELTSVTVPDSVTTIGAGAFWRCRNLEEAILPDSVTSIGSECFAHSYALKDIRLPAGLTKLESLFLRPERAGEHHDPGRRDDHRPRCLL